MDSNLIQPPASTPIDTGMHKEDHQATGGRTSLGVTSEERANPQLSSGMSAFNLNKPIYSTSFIIHSESASGCDASADSTAEADPGLSALSDFVPQQEGMNEGTKNTSYDHLSASTDPHVLIEEEESSSTIKLEDLAKLVSHVQPSFKDLDSPKDDVVIVVDEDGETKKDEVHPTPNAKIEDTSHKLELEKNKAEAEATLLKAQPSFPNVEQLKELLVKSLKTEFSNILSAHDFSSSLPTKLKDLPSKLNELTREVKGLKKQVHELVIELPGDLKEIPTKLDDFTKNVLDYASSKARDQSVPSVGNADTMPAEGEKNTNQATISQLFQRRVEKNAEKENLNNQQPKPTTPPTTTIIPPIITTTTTQMQTPPQNLQKGSSQPEGEHIKKDKGKKAMSPKDAKEVSTESDSDDETTYVPGSMVESSKKNAQKKIEEEAKAKAARREGEMRREELIDLLGPKVVNKYYNDKLQYDRYCDKMLNRRAKSRITNCDILTRKGLITLKVYKEDDTSEIIPEFKASTISCEWKEVFKAYPNKKTKGWTSIYKQIQERMDYLRITKAELGIDLDRPLSEQDPLDRLNDPANKKIKHADDIHDFFRANKRLKIINLI
ncbi:hypothetical protein Tco_1329359 [Tanacetum coccineum]